MAELERLLVRPMEAAAMLGVSRTKIYALLSSGEIPSIRIGSRGLRVPLEPLRRWIEERHIQAS